MEGPALSLSIQERECRPATKVWPGIPPIAKSAFQRTEPSVPLWRELALVGMLMLLAGGIRAWLINHTEVAARDSIGFIRYALELERYPWKGVLEHSLQHPGYPAAILAVSWPVRQFLDGTNYISMQLSAQLTSALAGVLLVIPMYYLGR